jgi:hypothetical protein
VNLSYSQRSPSRSHLRNHEHDKSLFLGSVAVCRFSVSSGPLLLVTALADWKQTLSYRHTKSRLSSRQPPTLFQDTAETVSTSAQATCFLQASELGMRESSKSENNSGESPAAGFSSNKRHRTACCIAHFINLWVSVMSDSSMNDDYTRSTVNQEKCDSMRDCFLPHDYLLV